MGIDIKTIINEYTKKNKQEDFGFTSQSDDDIKSMVTSKTIDIEEEYKKKLIKVEEIIMPLLTNLLASADNPRIHWPNRKPLLEEKIKEIISITRG